MGLATCIDKIFIPLSFEKVCFLFLALSLLTPELKSNKKQFDYLHQIFKQTFDANV